MRTARTSKSLQPARNETGAAGANQALPFTNEKATGKITVA